MVDISPLNPTHYLELENAPQGLIGTGVWGCVELFGLTGAYRAPPYISLLLFYTLQPQSERFFRHFKHFFVI